MKLSSELEERIKHEILEELQERFSKDKDIDITKLKVSLCATVNITSFVDLGEES